MCIDGLDHHCIWIGKCIGRKNIALFKVFLLVVFGTLAYGLVMSFGMTRKGHSHSNDGPPVVG